MAQNLLFKEAFQLTVKKMSPNKKAIVVGNFNVLHPGHVRLLKFAKSIADKLVVGVYDDNIAGTNVAVPQDLRLEAVSSIECVDEAKLVSTNLRDFLIFERPDFVVKGKEYENKFNIEHEILTSFGGQLLFSSGEINLKAFQERNDDIGLQTAQIDYIQKYLQKHGTKPSDLIYFIEQFTNKNVCVLGDMIVDEYIDCFPLGMSQEEPTIVVSQTNSRKFVGGAGIVASHASQLGANVHLICVTGHDQQRDFVAKELDANNVKYNFIVDEARPTTVKQRFRSDGRSLFRVSKLSQQAISAGLQQAIYDHFAKIVKDLDLLVFSDFNYGCLPQCLVRKIISLAKKHSVFIAADSQSSSQIGDISRFKDVQLITPTEREARIALQNQDDGLVVLSEKLMAKAKADAIILKLGSEGMIAQLKKGVTTSPITEKLEPLNRKPVDVSGAGDSVLISASLAMSAGASLWQASLIGNLAAFIQVGRVGNIPISSFELKGSLSW